MGFFLFCGSTGAPESAVIFRLANLTSTQTFDTLLLHCLVNATDKYIFSKQYVADT